MDDMDIDVVEGKDVSERGSEIEYKVPVPPPAQLLVERTKFEVEDYHDMQWVLDRYPNVTDLSFKRSHLSHHTNPKSPAHWRSSPPPKNLYLITEFKHLKRIHLENFGDFGSFIPKEFATSPTCTHLEFETCLFYLNKDDDIQAPDKLFARTVKRNKVLQSLSFNRCYIPREVLEIMMQSKSISELEFKATDIMEFDGRVFTNRSSRVSQLVPMVLANKNLVKFEFPLLKMFPEVSAQINAHLLENRQKLMVFPILAALQLGGRDKGAILDLLPMISEMLGDPPLTYEASEQMAQLIEPVVGGKRKTAEAKPLPFMFK